MNLSALLHSPHSLTSQPLNIITELCIFSRQYGRKKQLWNRWKRLKGPRLQQGSRTSTGKGGRISTNWEHHRQSSLCSYLQMWMEHNSMPISGILLLLMFIERWMGPDSGNNTVLSWTAQVAISDVFSFWYSLPCLCFNATGRSNSRVLLQLYSSYTLLVRHPQVTQNDLAWGAGIWNTIDIAAFIVFQYIPWKLWQLLLIVACSFH